MMNYARFQVKIVIVFRKSGYFLNSWSPDYDERDDAEMINETLIQLQLFQSEVIFDFSRTPN